MNPQEVFKYLISQNVIKPPAESDEENQDDNQYEPPLTKRRRLEHKDDRSDDVPAFEGLENVAGPSNPHVATPVKPVRRRLVFTEEQSPSSESSDITNPFASDNEDINYTNLQAIGMSTPVTQGETSVLPPTYFPLESFSASIDAASDFFSVPNVISPLHAVTPASAAGVQLPSPSTHKASEKHPIRDPCMCRKRCISMIPQERRVEIHATYWRVIYDERRNWLLQHRSKSGKAKSHHNYYFTNKDGVRKEVCLRFFLNTLGYSSNSVIEALGKSGASDTSMFVPSDRRERSKKPHALNEITIQRIDDHIERFNPSVSHYRREHAPNRRYISSDITIKAMFSSFQEENPNTKVSYESYRRRVASKNISFAKLGNEQCELCLLFQLHEHNPPLEDGSCVECKRHLEHKKKRMCVGSIMRLTKQKRLLPERSCMCQLTCKK